MDELKKQTNDLEEKLISNIKRVKKKAFLVFTILLILIFLVIIGFAISPKITSAFLQSVWIFAFIATFIFFAIGVLVFIGLRKEAARILDILLEGSLTVIDIVDFAKQIYKTFILLFKEFVIYATPAIAGAVAMIIYYLILIIYKKVGNNHDVSFLTVVITVITIAISGFLNRPGNEVHLSDWAGSVKSKFMRAFTDAFEIILALFFLTMDSTSLFFLPKDLNIPIFASYNGIDLMKRSFPLNDPSRTALTIILVSVLIESIRYSLRIIAVARKYFWQFTDSNEEEGNRSEYLKQAIRKSFSEAKDDTMKFITFTTVLIFVFLFFPRLKLLAVMVASATTLLMDLIIPSRLLETRGKDLTSRLIAKALKL